MNGRRSSSELAGFFSPLISAELLQRRLRSGVLQVSPQGIEKRCARCQEYWPFDSEFFFANKGTPDGLYAWCRACYVEHRWPEGRTPE